MAGLHYYLLRCLVQNISWLGIQNCSGKKKLPFLVHRHFFDNHPPAIIVETYLTCNQQISGKETGLWRSNQFRLPTVISHYQRMPTGWISKDDVSF
jgi:hypothetical protein